MKKSSRILLLIGATILIILLWSLSLQIAIWIIFTGPSYESVIQEATATENPELCKEIPFYRKLTREKGPILLGDKYWGTTSYREICVLESSAQGLRLRNTWDEAIETRNPSLCLTLSEHYGSQNPEQQCLQVYIGRTNDTSACELYPEAGGNLENIPDLC